VQNLLPREAYNGDETGTWKRLPIVTGVFFGAFMAPGIYFWFGDIPNISHRPTLAQSLFFGLLAGLFFGWLFPSKLRRRADKLIDQLFEDDEALREIESANDSFTYRLPCTWMKGALGIGGVLYIGRSSLLFLPHKMNRLKLAPLRFVPVTDLQVKVTDPPKPRNPLLRILIPHPQPRVEIHSASEVASFVVPSPVATAERLRQLLS
jgi:hypothetical protein